MSVNNIKVVDVGGLNVLPTRVYQTEANATAINPGEPVKFKTAGSRYVIPVADGEPVIGTTVAVVGIAKSASTQTASADGVVEVYIVDEKTVLRAKAKSSTAADTDAEILALAGKRVVLDLTSSVYTVDTAAADGATNGILLLGTGNASNNEVDFVIRVSALQGPIA